ncbi:MAG: hypothetical protein ACE5F7_11215, partial [Nitrospiria bacterium]
ACIFFTLFLCSCVKQGPVRKIVSPQYQIEISGFTEAQQASIEKTFAQLRALKPGDLKIHKNIYKRLSRFEALFGFSLNGEQLSAWVLSRMKRLVYGSPWTVAVNQNKGVFVLGGQFFEGLSDLERLYLLIHEARHSDGNGFRHVKCPKGFRFVSSGQPGMDLERTFACDQMDDGAYAFQSAFLFEVLAYGLFDQREAALLYNSSISRMIK